MKSQESQPPYHEITRHSFDVLRQSEITMDETPSMLSSTPHEEIQEAHRHFPNVIEHLAQTKHDLNELAEVHVTETNELHGVIDDLHSKNTTAAQHLRDLLTENGTLRNRIDELQTIIQEHPQLVQKLDDQKRNIPAAPTHPPHFWTLTESSSLYKNEAIHDVKALFGKMFPENADSPGITRCGNLEIHYSDLTTFHLFQQGLAQQIAHSPGLLRQCYDLAHGKVSEKGPDGEILFRPSELTPMKTRIIADNGSLNYGIEHREVRKNGQPHKDAIYEIHATPYHDQLRYAKDRAPLTLVPWNSALEQSINDAHAKLIGREKAIDLVQSNEESIDIGKLENEETLSALKKLRSLSTPVKTDEAAPPKRYYEKSGDSRIFRALPESNEFGTTQTGIPDISQDGRYLRLKDQKQDRHHLWLLEDLAKHTPIAAIQRIVKSSQHVEIELTDTPTIRNMNDHVVLDYAENERLRFSCTSKKPIKSFIIEGKNQLNGRVSIVENPSQQTEDFILQPSVNSSGLGTNALKQGDQSPFASNPASHRLEELRSKTNQNEPAPPTTANSLPQSASKSLGTWTTRFGGRTSSAPAPHESYSAPIREIAKYYRMTEESVRSCNGQDVTLNRNTLSITSPVEIERSPSLPRSQSPARPPSRSLTR